MGDGIANGTHVSRRAWRAPAAGAVHRAAHRLFTAPTASTTPARCPEWFQNFVLLTNYQFYIDRFVASTMPS